MLLSDTHGFVDPRIVVHAERMDRVVHAGDIGAQHVIEQLRRATPHVVAVRGNNDVDAPLATLPEMNTLELPGGQLVVLHGDRILPAHTRHAELRKRFAHARAVFYGHTHHAVIDQHAIPWILNAGAAGRVRTFGGPSYLEVTARAQGWSVRLHRLPPLPR